MQVLVKHNFHCSLKLVEQLHWVTDDQTLEVPEPVGVENGSIPTPRHPVESLINCVDESSANFQGVNQGDFYLDTLEMSAKTDEFFGNRRGV